MIARVAIAQTNHRVIVLSSGTASVNSTGAGAVISASGSASFAANSLFLRAEPVPNQNGIFFYGPQQVQVASGIGNLCVAGDMTMPAIRLYPALVADSMGVVTRQIDFTDPNQSMGAGAILPGATLNFQFWFRDNQMGAPTWNFTNGVSVVFCP